MDILSMCRICLTDNVRMHSIINTKLQETFERLTVLPFERKDCRPLQVCYICRARLRNCHQLQTRCLQSEAMLTQIMEKNMLIPRSFRDKNIPEIIHPLINISYQPDAQVEIAVEPKLEPVPIYDEVQIKQELTEEDYPMEHKNSLLSSKPEYTLTTEKIKIEDAGIQTIKDEYDSTSIIIKPEIEDDELDYSEAAEAEDAYEHGTGGIFDEDDWEIRDDDLLTESKEKSIKSKLPNIERRRDDEATTSTSTRSRGPRGRNAQYYRDYRARKRAEEKELLNRISDSSTINVGGSVTTKKRKSAAEYQREYRARVKAKRNNILSNLRAVSTSTGGFTSTQQSTIVDPLTTPGPSINPQTTAGSSINPQTTAGSSINPQTTAGSSINPQTTAGSSINPQTTSGSSIDPQTTSGSSINPQTTAGSSINPQTTSGSSINPKTTAGSSINPQTTAGSSINPQTTAGSSINPQTTAGSSINPQTTAGSSINPQTTSGSSIDPQTTSGSSINPQTTAGSSINPQTTSGSSINPKTTAGSSINQQTTAGSSINQQTTAGSSINSQTTAGSFINAPTTAGSSINPQTTSGSSINQQTTAGSFINAPTTAGSSINPQTTSGSSINQQTTAGSFINAPTTAGLPRVVILVLQSQQGAISARI